MQGPAAIRSEGARWIVAGLAFAAVLGIAFGLGLALCEPGRCAVPALDREIAVLADRWRHPALGAIPPDEMRVLIRDGSSTRWWWAWWD